LTPAHFEVFSLVFVLLVVFQLKHFIADFPLQNRYMLQKQRSDWTFIPPLALHSAIHAVTTLIVVLVVQPTLWWLAIADFVIHFTMDRIKAGPKYLGRYSDISKSGFWIALGFDQMVHHLTHIWIIWTLAVSLL
jgi:hypothetical protein